MISPHFECLWHMLFTKIPTIQNISQVCVCFVSMFDTVMSTGRCDFY